LIRDNIIDEQRLVELMAVNPAAILGIPGGTLSPGAAADITLIDPTRKFNYAADQVVSKSRNSPFLGWELQGRAVLTMVDGTIRYSLLA
jgi:dihydroorotase